MLKEQNGVLVTCKSLFPKLAHDPYLCDFLIVLCLDAKFRYDPCKAVGMFQLSYAGDLRHRCLLTRDFLLFVCVCVLHLQCGDINLLLLVCGGRPWHTNTHTSTWLDYTYSDNANYYLQVQWNLSLNFTSLMEVHHSGLQRPYASTHKALVSLATRPV